MSPLTQKSVHGMHRQFERWFARMLVRVGLPEAVRPRDPDAVAGDDADSTEPSNRLPWLAIADGEVEA